MLTVGLAADSGETMTVNYALETLTFRSADHVHILHVVGEEVSHGVLVTELDVAEIGYDNNRKINKLVIKDNKGKTVFTYGVKQADKPEQETPATISSGCAEWDKAMLEFISEGGNPEAFAKYCHKERAEQLTVEELRYGTSLKREARKAV